MPRSTSPLAPTLLDAADAGTAEVVDLLTRRRHKLVRGTRLPHTPGPSLDLDVAALLLRAATMLSEAHDTEAAGGAGDDGCESYRAEARACVARAARMLGL